MLVTVGPVLSDDGHSLAGVLQRRRRLFVRGHPQVHTVHLKHPNTHSFTNNHKCDATGECISVIVCDFLEE